MPTKEEIDRVVAWCEKLKAERKRPRVIERNPFRDDMEWMRRFPLIEIDGGKEAASISNLIYDSTTKTLWQFMNGDWRRVQPDFRIEK